MGGAPHLLLAAVLQSAAVLAAAQLSVHCDGTSWARASHRRPDSHGLASVLRSHHLPPAQVCAGREGRHFRVEVTLLTVPRCSSGGVPDERVQHFVLGGHRQVSRVLPPAFIASGKNQSGNYELP